jgi:hypothetical protein
VIIMGKKTKILLVISTICIVSGVALATLGLAWGGSRSVNWGANGFQVVETDSITVELEQILGNFTGIDIDADVYRLQLEPGSAYRLSGSYDQRYGLPEIAVQDGVLHIRGAAHQSVDSRDYLRDWFNLLGAEGFERPALDLLITYPAESSMEAVLLAGAAADLRMQDLNTARLVIQCSAGKLQLARIQADSVQIDLDAGDCDIEGLSANSASFTVRTGNFAAQNLETAARLDAQLDLGDIDLDGIFRGEVAIRSNMGDVTLHTSLPKTEYDYELNLALGEIKVNGRPLGSSVRNYAPQAENRLKIDATLGELRVNFGCE